MTPSPPPPDDQDDRKVEFFACPAGCRRYDDHVWDGPVVLTDLMGAAAESVTCSKCGRTAVDADLWEGF